MNALVRSLALAAACCAASGLAGCALFGRGGPQPPLSIELAGVHDVPKKDVLRALEAFFPDFEPSPHKKSVVDDWAYEIERFYKSRGHPFATARYDYEERADAKPRVRFRVDEGPRAIVDAVDIEGAEAFSAKELRSILLPRAKTLLQRAPDPYVEDKIESGAGKIADFYRANGFLDVRVDVAPAAFDEERKKARVRIRIEEDTRYTVATLDIDGADESVAAEIERIRTEYVTKPYALRTPREIQARIESAHADLGFPDVRAKRVKDEREGGGAVALAYSVAPGPRVTVESVEIHGNDKTRDGFILARLGLKPGEIASRKKLDRGASRLYQSGLFESVHVDWKGEGEARALAVDVVEAPSLELSVEPGYGSYERARVTGGVLERNVFGTGRILSATGTISELAESGKISWIDPWFVGSDVRTDVSVFGSRREEPSFERIELGTGVAFTKRWSRTLETMLGYQFRRSDVANIDPAAILAPDEFDDVDISEVVFSPTWDTRDNVFVPTRGAYTKASFELASDAIGSQLSFFRTKLSEAAFLAIDEKTELGVSVRTGWIIPFGQSETIPLQERFFNGGENTVRSFEENELGPKDANDNALGGEAWTVFSTEIRRELVGKLDGALFYDLGNVVPDHTDYFELEDFEEAIGVGLRYELPVGPIRLDYAVNPDPDGGDARDVLHFSVGMAF